MSTEHVIEGLPAEIQQTLRAYAKDVRETFGTRLEGLILYGSAVRGEFLPGRSNLNLLLLVSSYDSALLKQYGKLHRRWSKERIVVPLFLTEAELTASASVFPLEYSEIQEQHRLLGGRDPFVGFHVDTRHLTFEAVQGLRSNLLRLRQRFVEGGGTEEAATILLTLSITSVLPCLRGVQRALGKPVSAGSEALLKEVGSQWSLDLRGLHDALLLKRGQISPGPHEVPRLFDRYMHDLEALAEKAGGMLSRA